MPKRAADIHVVFRTVLKKEGDAEIGCETHRSDSHDPAAVYRNWLQYPFDSDDGDAKSRQQQNEGIEKCCDNTRPMVAEGAGFTRGSSGQDVCVEREKERPLVDELAPCVTHQPNAVQNPSTDEFCRNDDRVDPKCQMQTGSKMFVRGEGRHYL